MYSPTESSSAPYYGQYNSSNTQDEDKIQPQRATVEDYYEVAHTPSSSTLGEPTATPEADFMAMEDPSSHVPEQLASLPQHISSDRHDLHAIVTTSAPRIDLQIPLNVQSQHGHDIQESITSP